MSSGPEILPQLRAAGLIASAAPRLRSLAGGVSSDIFLVEDDDRRFVVKRALRKLRVKDDWFADVSRNRVEQAWFAYAARIVPEAVPRLLHTDPENAWFAMEYLEGDWLNWKSELLACRADPAVASRAGHTLGRLHAASWGDPAATAEFATLKNFTELRIAPYLLATADRVPAATAVLRAEAGRLAGTELALVHGDYSPKNLLISPGRLIVLDAEVAWFGDPVFDVAFLINHLFLKALCHVRTPEPFIGLADEAWRAYGAAMGGRADAALEARTVRLLLCLMLARVHGKSPVEYIAGPAQGRVTAFVLKHLPRPPATLAEVAQAWNLELEQVP